MEKTFYVNKKKQMALFATLVCILMIWSLFLLFFPLRHGRQFVLINGLCLICGFIPVSVRTFRSIRGYAMICDDGITTYVNGKTTTIPWREVKQVEIVGAKCVPFFDGAIIYGHGAAKTQIDFNFQDYTQLICLIVEMVKKNREQPLILGKPQVIDRLLGGR